MESVKAWRRFEIGLVRLGFEVYLTLLRWSPRFAPFALRFSTLLNGSKGLAQALAKAQEERHPLFQVVERLSREVSPGCRRSFLQSHVPLLFQTQDGKGFFPKVLIISVTSRCNFTCKDCFNNTFHERADLDEHVLDRLLTEAEEEGTRIVALSGGEPLMRRDLLDIVARHRRLYFQVFTNGSLIDEAVAERMERLGNVMPFISLEGGEEETDCRRGRGCYRRVLRAMERLKSHGVIFGANVMVTPGNLEKVTSDSFVKELVERGALVIWYITYRPVGRSPDPGLVLSWQEHLRLYRRVQSLRSSHPIVALENLHDVASFGGCPAKLGVAIHIDHQGNVTPCPPIHFSNQSIKRQSLRQALRNSPLIERIMAWEGRGCIILDAPEELARLVESTGARETSPGYDLVALRRYAELRGEHRRSGGEMERAPDLYEEVKEVLRWRRG